MQGADKAPTRAIVRRPGPDFCAGLTTSTVPPPTVAEAQTQHTAYCQALRACGLVLHELPAAQGFPDGPFVEDTAIILEAGALLMRPGAAARRGEVPSIKKALSTEDLAIPVLGQIEAPGTVDGGDILRNGYHFWIGLSARTNEPGAEQLTAMLEAQGFSVTTIAVAAGLHLKSGVTSIAPGLLLAAPDFAQHPALRSRSGLTILEVPESEAYAANVLGLGATLLCPAGYPKTLSLLQAAGLAVIVLEMSAFRKMDGALTCCSLLCP